MDQIAWGVGIKLSQLKNVKKDVINARFVAKWPITEDIFDRQIH